MRGEILFSEPVYGAIYADGLIDWNVIRSFYEGIQIVKNENNRVVGIAVRNQYYLSNGSFRPARGQKHFISGMIVNRENALALCEKPEDKEWIARQINNAIFIYNFKTHKIVRFTKNFSGFRKPSPFSD